MVIGKRKRSAVLFNPRIMSGGYRDSPEILKRKTTKFVKRGNHIIRVVTENQIEYIRRSPETTNTK